MLSRKLLPALGFLLAMTASPAVNAGELVLDSPFLDQSPATINLPATRLLMATINTSSVSGGANAVDTTVSIGGGVAASDVAEVCWDYGGGTPVCVTNPASLGAITIGAPGGSKGGSPFNYSITLNSSAGGKTIQLTVSSITVGGGKSVLTDNVNLPQSTQTRPIAGAGTPPTVGSPTFASVTFDSAILGGTVTDAGTPATLTDCGIEWGTATGSYAGGSASFGVCTLNTPFTVGVGGLPSSDTIYFRAWADNSLVGVSSEATFVTKPSVTTTAATGIAPTQAVLGGNVAAGGGAAVTGRGVYWHTAPGATAGTKVAMGSGSGAFSSTVGSLSPATTYYFVAYATNSSGETVAVNELPFTTAAVSLPTVATRAVADIAVDSATLGGNITSDGGAAVTVRGIVWNTTNIWNIANPPASEGTDVPMGSGSGDFFATVGDLPTGTVVYFKAYATNTQGTAYSDVQPFTPAGAPVVTIGTETDLTSNSVTLGGNVTSDGGATVTQRGIVWNTTNIWNTANPPASEGTVVTMGSGTGTYTGGVGGLDPNVTYYYKAFATNTSGTGYSAPGTFTTLAGLATVATRAVTGITADSATLGGNITSDGGAAVTVRGIVWNTTNIWNIANPPASEGTDVPMGSGSGDFFATVGSLPTGTVVYFKAYATNAAGTAYSAVQFFTPASGQATNITFPGVYGKSLRISWTPGNGDGSIVVMRLDTDASTDPVDGTDYAANPDYTLAAPINAQNLVVYKGSSSTVWVTGLELSTTYSVTVYDYTGSGASTVYQLTTPAQASKATSNVASHNYDNRVLCTDCHDHGTWIPRGDQQKAACVTCHNPAGQASAKLEFDNHLTPGSNPNIAVVDCGMCHELHALSGGNTTESLNSVTLQTQHNKSFLRANVNKYVTNAAAAAYLHTDQPKRAEPPIDADTPDRAVEGGDETTARGYCQVCHSYTKYHRNIGTQTGQTLADGTIASNHELWPLGEGDPECHDGSLDYSLAGCGNGVSATPTVDQPQVHCGECHQHNNKFIGAGGSVSCVICHAPGGTGTLGANLRPAITTQFDRLTTHIPGGSTTVTQEDCAVCHEQSTHVSGMIVRGKDLDVNGVFYSQPTAGADTLASGEGEAFAPHCLSCHDDGSADTLPASGSDQTATSPFTGSGAPPVINETAWAGAAHNRPSASFSPAMTCVGDGANGCHGSGHGSENLALLAPVGGPATAMADFCIGCHDGTPAVDVSGDFTGPTMTEISGSKALINTRHDVTAEDQAYSLAQLSCADCHRPHSDAAGFGVSDLMTGTTLRNYSPNNTYDNTADLSPAAGTYNFSYNGGGNLDPVNPEGSAGGFTEPDTIQFCLVCHDGNGHLPAGVVQDGNMENIADAWAGADVHGAGNATGVGSSVNKGGMKFPWVTSADDALNYDPSANYAAMNCTTCHGAHGSENIFNLRTSITVGGVQMSIGGNGNMPIPARITDPTVYDLPRTRETARNSGIFVQEDHYWGAWCSFCHKMDGGHPAKVEIDSCTNGHMHNGGAF